ncbi:MAG: amidohydrolase family protein [Deltaproteobacteria bacterium]|nr:amidohydrolase family protein [Deltaproteobacteria bacterium]
MNFDTLIEGATVYDGTGRMPYRADIALAGGRIADIGQLDDAAADRRIDARGKVLCPGFIDVHSHADTVVHFDTHAETLEPLLRQGITTFVGGNCGMGLAPIRPKFREQFMAYVEMFLGRSQEGQIHWSTMAEYLDHIESRGMVMNYAMLAPHGIIRLAAMGLDRSLASPDQLMEMGDLLRECLDAGCVGMSTGLQYFPGLSADEDELVELGKQISAADGVFTSHIRSYSNTLPQAIDELMAISRRSGVKVQLSHLFWVPHVNLYVDRVVNSIARVGAAIYKHVKIPVPLDLAMREKLQYMGDEIRRGLPMGMDAMPTGAGFTHALAFFPPWALEGTREEITNRLRDPAQRQKIHASIVNGKSVWPHRDGDTWSMNFFQVMGFQSVHLMSVPEGKNSKYIGKHFVEIGKLRGQHPFDAVCDMLLEEDGKVLVFETPTWPGDEFTERSVYASIADPNVSIVTDSILIGQGKPSHLFYDCYPKLFGKYVREEKRLSLEEAVRKSTSLPAKQLGIPKRGEIRRGWWADLVLFDAETVDTNSTASEPDVFPTGVEYVFVNGHAAVSPAGYHPEPRKGRVVRRGEN